MSTINTPIEQTWSQRFTALKESFISPHSGDPKTNNLTRAAHALPDNLVDTIANIESKSSLARIINFVSEGIFFVNARGQITLINHIAARLLGEPKEALIGRELTSFLTDQYVNEYLHMFAKIAVDSSIQLNHGPKEVALQQRSGDLLPADLSLSSLPDVADTDEAVIIGVLHDLTAHQAEYGKLRRQARTDYLTGIANRHGFAESLEASWKEGSREGYPLSLLMIDVDEFKVFNDEHGHLIGDKCLQLIASTIELCLPARDCVAARFGGEEFAVLLPRCSAQVVQLIAIRIKRHIGELKFTDLGLPATVNVSVSIGIASQRDGVYKSSDELIAAADGALYIAKNSGRNTISVA
ncbi:GGDEF domain-containing protein [Alteromonas gilva]|uniref:diguanylate cyclase n=1 Tax=Alteromonas gilva TaxID=2987522 RepID=A0ABT5L343_9ALTE|nr:diguanylate cyclase [Alteromonas gilva]MDC8830844.1 diguanylate cyclase [Alteromonas gilva]